MATKKLKSTAVDVLRERKTAYGQTFDTEAAKAVIEDLKRFCRANESTFHVDARAHAVLEGRREVWLRIQDYMELSVEQLTEKYGKPPQRRNIDGNSA